MPDLEAKYTNAQNGSETGWRKPLPDGKQLRLGRLPAQSDWWVGDPLISGHHAQLTWTGSALQVKERTPPPVNKIYYRDKPAEEFACGPGESFVIGTTVFTIRDGGVADSQNWADATIAAQDVKSRSELRKLPFENAVVTLRALESCADVLRLATDEEMLFQSMLRVLLEAIPSSDAAAIVQVPPESADGAPRCVTRSIVERGVGTKERFTPSRKLSDKAIRRDRRSVLYAWTKDLLESSNMTVGADQRPGTPWAVCTPFQDESGLGLYVAGRLTRPPDVKDGKLVDRELTEYQKLIELIGSLIESTRKSHDLERQLTLYRRFLPRRLWGETDRAKLDAILAPRQTEVAVLFCDLRGSCRFAEDGSENLTEAWEQLSGAIDEMCQQITNEDGIVAGFQGDAVMAFWGWPDPQTDAVVCAARAALKLRERFDTDGRWKQFSCGIGIAFGPAVAGRLGAHDLAKVDVFGPTVNLASRLESLTKPLGVHILVDSNTAVAVMAADPTGRKIRARRLPTVRPAGMTRSVELFEILPPDYVPVKDNPTPAQLKRWNDEVMKLFASGDWKLTRERLQQFFPHDAVAKFVLREMGMATSPPSGWDGVIAMTSK